MFGLLELLFLLFSAGDMMLTALVKPFIADTVRETMSIQSNMINVTHSESHEDFTNSTRGNSSFTELGLSQGNSSSSLAAPIIENLIQKRVATYLMIDLVGVYVPNFISSIVCGAWSDRYGRKLPLLLPCLGHVMSVAVYALINYDYKAYLLGLLIGAALCRGLLGKGAVFSMSVCSLLSDTVPEHQRSSRFAYLMAARNTGVCLGSLLSGVLQDIMGVLYGMFASALLQIVCVILILVLVNETITDAKENVKHGRQVTKKTIALIETVLCCLRRQLVSNRAKSKEYTPILSEDKNYRDDQLLDTQEMKAKEGYTTMQVQQGEAKSLIATTDLSPDDTEEEDSLTKGTVKRDKARCEGEDGELRRRWWLMLIAMVLLFVMQSVMSSQTELLVMTTTAPPLSWPASWYGYATSVYFGAAGLGLFLLGPCQKSLLPQSSAGDCIVLIVAMLCCAVSAVWTGLASTSYYDSLQIFAAYVLAAQGLMSTSVLRTLVSKAVSSHSFGKAMGALSVLENLAKVLGPLLNTAVYVATLATSPAIVYYVMGGEAFLLMPFVWIIYYASKSVVTS